MAVICSVFKIKWRRKSLCFFLAWKEKQTDNVRKNRPYPGPTEVNWKFCHLVQWKPTQAIPGVWAPNSNESLHETVINWVTSAEHSRFIQQNAPAPCPSHILAFHWFPLSVYIPCYVHAHSLITSQEAFLMHRVIQWTFSLLTLVQPTAVPYLSGRDMRKEFSFNEKYD